jgi:hypothetical protein
MIEDNLNTVKTNFGITQRYTEYLLVPEDEGIQRGFLNFRMKPVQAQEAYP